MKDRKKKSEKRNDERMEAFSSLPPAIRNSLTSEERIYS